MAINKNAFLRYKILDKCFRNTGRRYTIQDLIKECSNALLEANPQSNGISRRQIYADIAFMESEDGWSVELDKQKEGKTTYYAYSDRSYSINNAPMNDLECRQLTSLLELASQFSGLPQLEWVSEALLRLKQRVSDYNSQPPIIGFDENKYLKGKDWLADLYQAILYKKVLRISYLPYQNEKPIVFEIHPYYLKQFNKRWYLLGYNSEKGSSTWNLAIDRMVEIEFVENVPYVDNVGICWDEYFEDLIGVTKPEDAVCEEVRIHFYGKTGYYIETKPIHESQRGNWIDENTYEVRLNIIINQELERFLFSYANCSRVYGPDKLVSTLQSMINDARQQYTFELADRSNS